MSNDTKVSNWQKRIHSRNTLLQVTTYECKKKVSARQPQKGKGDDDTEQYFQKVLSQKYIFLNGS